MTRRDEGNTVAEDNRTPVNWAASFSALAFVVGGFGAGFGLVAIWFHPALLWVHLLQTALTLTGFTIVLLLAAWLMPDSPVYTSNPYDDTDADGMDWEGDGNTLAVYDIPVTDEDEDDELDDDDRALLKGL